MRDQRQKTKDQKIKDTKSVLLISFLFLVFSLWSMVYGLWSVYALNIDTLKTYFLRGEYDAAILEGESLISREAQTDNADELYYILGLSYLKKGNYLRASDIFEIILKEFKNSKLKDAALLALADSYFLKGDLSKAKDSYEELIKDNPRTKFRAIAYNRLSNIGFKQGNTQEGKDYLDKVKEEYPLNLEIISMPDIPDVLDKATDYYYTVQVGSFTSSANAENLKNKLIQEGYPAFIEENNALDTGKYYRVRVGKFRLRQQAVVLADKLSYAGYPTKICP